MMITARSKFCLRVLYIRELSSLRFFAATFDSDMTPLYNDVVCLGSWLKFAARFSAVELHSPRGLEMHPDQKVRNKGWL